MKLYVKDIQTMSDLQAWVDERLAPSKVVLDTNGEVVIRTGLTVEMNGELYPLKWETDNE